MPNKDGTGPKGEGSKTGSQNGNCEGAEPIVRMRGQRRCGCGRHRGLGNRFK